MRPIEFSRHARRRMRLYRIEPEDVRNVIERDRSRADQRIGTFEIVAGDLAAKYGHPLKVVFSSEEDKMVVITAYPLSKEYGK